MPSITVHLNFYQQPEILTKLFEKQIFFGLEFSNAQKGSKLHKAVWILRSQDQFRIGLRSYSLLLTSNAHYGISALHSYVFLTPFFVTHLLSCPDFPSKSGFMQH